MGRNLPGYVTVDIRTFAPWLVNLQPNALYTKQKLLPLTKVNSTLEHQMESSKLGLTTISARLGTKEIQLMLNFSNTSKNYVRRKFSTRLNEINVYIWLAVQVYLCSKSIIINTTNQKFVFYLLLNLRRNLYSLIIFFFQCLFSTLFACSIRTQFHLKIFFDILLL